MAWYRAGTVAVTNGSAVVTGTATAFVSNVQPGHAINLPDGKVYEVAAVNSDTQITLGSAYLGATANGQAYQVQPNQGFAQQAASVLATFLSQFQSYIATALAGLFGDGTAARPGIAFISDQDTGWRRYAENVIAWVTGGVDRGVVDSAGNVGIGTTTPVSRLHVSLNGAQGIEFFPGQGTTINLTQHYNRAAGNYLSNSSYAADHRWAIGATEAARIDTSSNLLVGVTSGSSHTIAKAVAEGGQILGITYNSAFYYATGGGFSGAATAFAVQKNSNTGRSINAAGTINASGADYAEYMRKAAGCGTILKGDICGVNANGELVRTWADAVAFMVKSTNPNLVGGDSWDSHLPPRPEAPALVLPEYFGPAAPAEGETDPAYDDAVRAHAAAVGKAEADHAAAMAQFETDLAAWQALHDEARSHVDRIAYCGQVPVNFDGACAPGDYIVAAANGGGIKGVAVHPDDMTIAQYMRRVGKVLSIGEDGRPIIDVQHG